MTIVGVAPDGFPGTTLGVGAEGVRADQHARRQMMPFFKGFDNRRSYWVYLFGRLKPGVTIAQATASLERPVSRRSSTTVEAPLQKGMSDATMAKFKAKQIDVTPGARGQSSMRKEARRR